MTVVAYFCFVGSSFPSFKTILPLIQPLPCQRYYLCDWIVLWGPRMICNMHDSDQESGANLSQRLDLL